MNSIKGLKKRIGALGAFIAKEPYIFVGEKGDVFVSENAKRFISEKKIKEDAFACWLKDISGQMKNLRYCSIEMVMMRLPDGPDDMIAIFRENGQSQEDESFRLTEREKEILGFSIKCGTNKEIAARLEISPGTVNSHLDSIYRKLGVSNRLGAVLKAIKYGLITSSFEPEVRKKEL